MAIAWGVGEVVGVHVVTHHSEHHWKGERVRGGGEERKKEESRVIRIATLRILRISTEYVLCSDLSHFHNDRLLGVGLWPIPLKDALKKNSI